MRCNCAFCANAAVIDVVLPEEPPNIDELGLAGAAAGMLKNELLVSAGAGGCRAVGDDNTLPPCATTGPAAGPADRVAPCTTQTHQLSMTSDQLGCVCI